MKMIIICKNPQNEIKFQSDHETRALKRINILIKTSYKDESILVRGTNERNDAKKVSTQAGHDSK